MDTKVTFLVPDGSVVRIRIWEGQSLFEFRLSRVEFVKLYGQVAAKFGEMYCGPVRSETVKESMQ
jgi:hypothetical protein